MQERSLFHRARFESHCHIDYPQNQSNFYCSNMTHTDIKSQEY